MKGLAVTAMVLIVGCGGTATTIPAATVSPASGLFGANHAFAALRQACDDELNSERQGVGNDLASLQGAARQAVTTYDHCAQQFRALAMPSEAQADQRALVTELDKFSALWGQVASASSLADLQPLLTTLTAEESAEHAAVVAVERDLGLPETTPRV